MKKWKIILSSVLVCIAAAACGTAIGCKKHSHSFSKDWSYDETHHWHAATCNDTDERRDLEEHTLDADKSCDCGYKYIPGISITKAQTEYNLVGSQTVNVQVDDIRVNYVNEDGTLGEAVSASEYTLEIYKGQEEVSDLSAATNGTYNIWAKRMDSTIVQESFVVVYVVDTVTEIQRELGFKTSQDIGLDSMSATWKFTVKYSSGYSKTIGVDDEHITVNNFSTFTAGQRQAQIIYSETNCKGEQATQTLNVQYTINNSSGDNVTINTYSFNALRDSLPEDKQNLATLALTSDDFTGQNAFIEVAGGTVNYRGPTNNVLEIRGAALNVTFEGVGVLVIGARSTSKTNISAIALMDSDGKYIAATYPSSSTTVQKDDEDNIYTVTGDANTLTFNIEKAGTYTICTLDGATVNGEAIGTGRNTRISDISMTDVKVG